MTLARELSESNGKLLQRPVHEAESLRQQHQSVSPRTISNKYVLQENAQAVEIQLQWALKNSDAEHYGLQLGTGMRLYIDNQSDSSRNRWTSLRKCSARSTERLISRLPGLPRSIAAAVSTEATMG